MPIIQLQHDKRLGYSSKEQLPAIPRELIDFAKEENVVTFRRLQEGKPAESRRGIHACVRFLDLPEGDLTFLNVETDSPLAPLLLWDAAHTRSVGNAIKLIGDLPHSSFLERAYFQDSFQVESRDKQSVSFRKIAPLRAEQDRGLDEWTFGIPVGPEDATLLNVVVKRILELDIEKKEIILCGRPGANFKYWNQVRIVGEDIPAPPVRIATKKNRLVQEARYRNLCVLHDRVFLPLDFLKAMNKYGDFYSLTTLQSLFFDDQYHLIPRRYSDYNKASPNLTNGVTGLSKGATRLKSSPFSPTVFAELETSGFIYGNPLRDPANAYPTGSLYIVKKSVWEFCPQDDDLYWTEFEDVEHGIRAYSEGIPSRVNPYAITQSIAGRPLISVGGAIQYEEANGRKKTYKSPFEIFPITRKPLIKMSRDDAEQKARLFIQKYFSRVDQNSYLHELSSLNSTLERCMLLAKLIYGASFEIKENVVKEFINDVEKHLILDQVPYSKKQFILQNISQQGRDVLHVLVENNWELINQVSQRPKGDMFYQKPKDLLPRRSKRNRLGMMVSALYLSRKNGGVFHLSRGVLIIYSALRNSTPYRDYAEE